jgi:anti-sigma regulatory factor (Ser/Thr protein kinase)
MQSHQIARRNGRAATRSRPNGTRVGSEELGAVCERQAQVIETLAAAVATLRRGAAALKAENAELRAAAGRIRPGGREGAEVLEASLPLDARAPGAARIVVARLRGRIPASVLDTAQLLVTELVTNSVCHSGASAGASVGVRVRLTDSMVRLEVSDPGCEGVIAPRAPDLEGGGGFGLNVVRTCSERWGLEQVAARGTRVWAQLARAPAAFIAGAQA